MASSKSKGIDLNDQAAMARFMAQPRSTHPSLARQRAARPTDAELPVYSMDESIPTCPICGARTDFTEPSPGVQIHQCLSCGYRFRVEDARARRRARAMPVRSAAKKCPPGKKRVGSVCKRKRNR